MCACPGWKFHRKGRRKRGERSRGWVVYLCPSLLTSFATCTGGRLIPWRIGGHRDWFVTRHDLRGWPPWNSIVPGAFRHRPPPSSREQKVYISKSTERERRLEIRAGIWNWVTVHPGLSFESSRRGGEGRRRGGEKSREKKGKRRPYEVASGRPSLKMDRSPPYRRPIGHLSFITETTGYSRDPSPPHNHPLHRRLIGNERIAKISCSWWPRSSEAFPFNWCSCGK